MYAYIYGEIIEKEPENLVIECNHIGYNIHIAPGMLSKFPAIGQMARVYTYTGVREDAFWLYGFTSKDELSLFKLLITVSGIGPKAAMGILSVMDVDTIRLAVISQDAKLIAKAPGVGEKSASRIVLELKDKIGVASTWEAQQQGTTTQAASDAELAMVALGFKQAEARKCIVKLLKDNPQAGTDELIRGALRQLS